MLHRPALPVPALPVLALTLGLALAGCIQVPELDEFGDPKAQGAAYPDLIPLDPVVARSTDPVQASADLKADLAGRTAALQRRADALRQTDVLDDDARQRLLTGMGQ